MTIFPVNLQKNYLVFCALLHHPYTIIILTIIHYTTRYTYDMMLCGTVPVNGSHSYIMLHLIFHENNQTSTAKKHLFKWLRKNMTQKSLGLPYNRNDKVTTWVEKLKESFACFCMHFILFISNFSICFCDAFANF